MSYSFTPETSAKACHAKVSYLRTHFKNMREVAAAIKGMKLEKAVQYLGQVTDHKRCIPFRRYNGSIGRTGQAREFKSDKGRWPVKSIEFMQKLLQNLKGNATSKGLEVSALVLRHVQVNQAPKIRRRTFRAHGRITPYVSSPCHVEIVAAETLPQIQREKQTAAESVPTSRRQLKYKLRFAKRK